MSMIKQLWIAIALVALLALGGSLVVSTLSARHYLEQQLQLKNLDNASSLALSMSQMPKDPVTIELLVSAQFDAGHYQYIRLSDPSGAPLVLRENRRPVDGVPEWFMRLVPIDAPEGVAQVQDGWKQFGTVSVKSHSRFVYQSLWDGTMTLLLWFLAGGVVCAALGTLLLRRVVDPLHAVVHQAQAMGERRFLTVREPGTAELRAVVSAMNTLSGRVRSMLAEESARLDQVRREAQNDGLTGLLNREHFLSRVSEALADENAAASGTLAIVRVAGLGAINEKLGHEAGDAILRRLAAALETIQADHQTRTTGRLNGTDLALLVADDLGPLVLASQLNAAVDLAVGKRTDEIGEHLPIGIAAYRRGDPLDQVLAHADLALERSRQSNDGQAVAENVDARLHPAANLSSWRSAIRSAVDAQRMSLRVFPVVRANGSTLHHDAPVRIRLSEQGEWLAAGEFMPWATRTGLLASVDNAVLDMALAWLERERGDICINLATESMCDAAILESFAARLIRQPALASRIWIDLPEAAAFRHPDMFRKLCAALKPLGCRIGLEHFGQYVCRIGDLHDVGLDYLKIASAVIRGIDHNPGNQAFLRGLVTIAHTMGILVIAEGVASDAEARQVKAIGFDALTGPGVRLN